jgi:hypothetical protein
MNPETPETLDDDLPPDSEEEVEEDEDFDDDGQPDSYQEHLDFAQDDGPYYDDGDF